MLCAVQLERPPVTRPLLLIQTGEAPDPLRARLGGFADWFRAAMQLAPEQMQVVRVDEGLALPPPREIAGAVITGSAAMVTDRADWSEATAAWIRDAHAQATPMFGVCYGHQLMAHALGGEVGWLPEGREIGTTTITRHASTQHADALPDTFAAHTTHRQTVLAPPAGAQVLAHSARDPHQWLRYGAHAQSTQFHPEFTVATMRAYIDTRAEMLREEGYDPAALCAEVIDTAAARGLLQRFARAALAETATA